MATTTFKGRNVAVDVSLLIAALSAAFVLGGHLMNDGIHEDDAIKNMRVRSVIDREITPELVRIRADVAEINRKMDALLKSNGR
jgi:hypothetical protein